MTRFKFLGELIL